MSNNHFSPQTLFEYIFHHENDVKNVSVANFKHKQTLLLLYDCCNKNVLFFHQAVDLAAQATEHAQFKDWWWKVQLGKCYYRQVNM